MDSFVFSDFILSIFHSIHFFYSVVFVIDLLVCVLKHSITFENSYQQSKWFDCRLTFVCINFSFCETLAVINSVIRILLTVLWYKFMTIKC